MGNQIGKPVGGRNAGRNAANWTPLPVPWAVQTADRIPKQRYYDPEFYALETEMFWPRVWQMACRLEEIPKPGDFVEYEILDQSIIVVRVDSQTVRAYDNACRHRGVKLVEGNGSRRTFVCPFHGWCWGIDGRNTYVARPEVFAEDNLCPDDLQLVSVRCELWGGCAWINLDEGAPPLRDCMEPFASIYDAWKVESLRTEWWQSCRLPVNWKLATAAFMEGYHVPQTHPQLLPSAQSGSPTQSSKAVHPIV
ncbi:MAG: aromatic ring-hydroxylating dioxygenase subunit alpha, partial [Mycobacterium sp.]